jgi:AcrR family transcriptional regulator
VLALSGRAETTAPARGGTTLAAPPKRDGRRERTVRTHKAIVAAVLELVDEGVFEPTAAQIAERAGVAVRSIRVHFASREELFLAAVSAHAARTAPARATIDASLPLGERVAVFAEVRARDLELSSAIRRASSLLDGPLRNARASSAVARAVDAAWHRRRGEAAQVFARELESADDPKALLDAVDLASHGRTWDTMRFAMGLSQAAATALLRRSLAALLEPPGPRRRPDARRS